MKKMCSYSVLKKVVQKARIKIVACAIYTYLFFSYTYTLLLCWEAKKCFDCCLLQQIRPLTTVPLCILQDYSSVRIVFNINLKRHTMPIVYTMLI